ncbi:MAG: protein kinase, partial [Kofleriaceae bacterium]
MEDDPVGDATLRGSGPPTDTESPTLERSGQDSLPISLTLPEPGYELGAVIGSGGMGEVLVANDKRIGREVAVKRMRGRSSEAVGRFLREARIQARLDHPAIVPVHELGIDAEGRPFFTMKRLSGITLIELLRANVPGDRPDNRQLNPLL